MADDQRIRPSILGRARLLQAIEAVAPPHVVDTGTLGEFAQVVAERGRAQADRQFPEVAAHLVAGCDECNADLVDLVAVARDDDEESLLNVRAFADLSTPQTETPPVVLPAGPSPRPLDDSGIHVRDLPDPRAAEVEAEAQIQAEAQRAAWQQAELTRRQQLRKWRERLLIAAAAAVLLMGLSLIGMAYLASGSRETPRLELAPQPAATPGQSAPAGQPAAPQATAAPGGQPAPNAPSGSPAPAGFAAPNGTSCPSTHPIKGNRNSGIYHAPGGSLYEATRPEQCFAQPSDAEAAGYRRSQR